MRGSVQANFSLLNPAFSYTVSATVKENILLEWYTIEENILSKWYTIEENILLYRSQIESAPERDALVRTISDMA